MVLCIIITLSDLVKLNFTTHSFVMRKSDGKALKFRSFLK
jgi:hypothetical protein